ncbi:Hypothetical predicted protein [Mytilus galloprovincialis]|uniref:Uncharacterized protein n=1 Tax=Mytilus galloprovincialis TaxID=29158 RepID=A0A8B6E1Y1_MYTGA|nr:Hypothetical predicted protein [Mytilus galloprovincialis]
MLYFGRRGRENIHELKITDFTATTDADGRVYIYMSSDELTKNHQQAESPIVISSRPSNQNTASAAVITSAVLQTTTSYSLPNTTILPVVSTQLNIPGACGTDQYSEDACHKVDCEIQMCSDSALKGLCPHYCNRECGHRDCSDIPGYISN